MPPLVRTLDSVRMIAYAGATWDWHRVHHDRDYLTAHGLQRPVVDGQMLGGLLAMAIREWLGRDAVIRRLAFRYAGLVYAGETVRCEGEVIELREGVVELTLRVGVIDDGGGILRYAISSASAEVVYG